MNYVTWALIGMVAYSMTTLFVKLATRSHEMAAFNVLAIAVSIVAVCVWTVTLAFDTAASKEWKGFAGMNALWTIAAGLSLAVAVSALFRALAAGPASVVVPLYGMFIVGGAVLGITVLGEALSVYKALGLFFALASVFFITR